MKTFQKILYCILIAQSSFVFAQELIINCREVFKNYNESFLPEIQSFEKKLTTEHPLNYFPELTLIALNMNSQPSTFKALSKIAVLFENNPLIKSSFKNAENVEKLIQKFTNLGYTNESSPSKEQVDQTKNDIYRFIMANHPFLPQYSLENGFPIERSTTHFISLERGEVNFLKALYVEYQKDDHSPELKRKIKNTIHFYLSQKDPYLQLLVTLERLSKGLHLDQSLNSLEVIISKLNDEFAQSFSSHRKISEYSHELLQQIDRLTSDLSFFNKDKAFTGRKPKFFYDFIKYARGYFYSSKKIGVEDEIFFEFLEKQHLLVQFLENSIFSETYLPQLKKLKSYFKEHTNGTQKLQTDLDHLIEVAVKPQSLKTPSSKILKNNALETMKLAQNMLIKSFFEIKEQESSPLSLQTIEELESLISQYPKPFYENLRNDIPSQIYFEPNSHNFSSEFHLDSESPETSQ